MKNSVPNRPNLLKIIQDNYDNKQKQLRKGSTPSSLRSQANMSNPSMDYMYDAEMFYNGGYISDRAKATQFGQYKMGGGYFPPYHSYTPPRMEDGGDISIPNLNNDDMNIMDYMRYGGIYAYADGGNTKASIVDYLDAQGMASDKTSRKKLAESMGIKNYTGSYDQNVEMVTRLNNSRYNPSQQASQNPYVVAPSQTAPAQSGFGSMPRMSQTAPRQAAPAPRTSKKPAAQKAPAQQQVMGQDSGFRPYSSEQLNQMYNFPGTLNFKKPATTAKQASAQKTKQANAERKQEDQRNLESGMVTDKGTNMTHVIKNGKIVKSFPVLTGQARDVNYNPPTLNQVSKNPSLRGTPVGTYFSKPDANLYGEKGFRMNPIPAFGQEAPRATNLAQHITFGQHEDPTEYRRREALYNQSPASRATSYGCTNCRKPDLDYIVNAFPQGDTTMVIDSRRAADANLLKTKFKKKEYGGDLYHYNPGGPILPGTLNTAVKEMMYDQSAASGVPPLLARPADQMDNFVGPMQPPQYAGAPAQSKNALQDYQGPSVYDFLSKQGKAGDYQSRKALAQKLGISGYKGSAEQNAQMIEMIRQNPDVLSDYSQAPASSSQPRKSNVVKTKQPSQSKLPSSTTRYGMDYTGMPQSQVQKIGMPGSISFGSGSIFEQIPVNQPTRSAPKPRFQGKLSRPWDPEGKQNKKVYSEAFNKFNSQIQQGKTPFVPYNLPGSVSEVYEAALKDFAQQGYKDGGEYGDYTGTYSAGVYYGEGGSFIPEFYSPEYGLPEMMYGTEYDDDYYSYADGGETCPPGYGWDGELEQCVKLPQGAAQPQTTPNNIPTVSNQLSNQQPSRESSNSVPGGGFNAGFGLQGNNYNLGYDFNVGADMKSNVGHNLNFKVPKAFRKGVNAGELGLTGRYVPGKSWTGNITAGVPLSGLKGREDLIRFTGGMGQEFNSNNGDDFMKVSSGKTPLNYNAGVEYLGKMLGEKGPNVKLKASYNRMNKYGGSMYNDGGLVKGGEYDMSEQEIQNLIDQGYKIQYI